MILFSNNNVAESQISLDALFWELAKRGNSRHWFRHTNILIFGWSNVGFTIHGRCLHVLSPNGVSRVIARGVGRNELKGKEPKDADGGFVSRNSSVVAFSAASYLISVDLISSGVISTDLTLIRSSSVMAKRSFT